MTSINIINDVSLYLNESALNEPLYYYIAKTDDSNSIVGGIYKCVYNINFDFSKVNAGRVNISI